MNQVAYGKPLIHSVASSVLEQVHAGTSKCIHCRNFGRSFTIRLVTNCETSASAFALFRQHVERPRSGLPVGE